MGLINQVIVTLLRQDHLTNKTLNTKNHYRNAYGNQTWQDDKLPRGAPACKVTQPFHHMDF